MKKGVWVNNAFVDSSTGDVLRVLDPATEEVVDEVLAGGVADVDRAVQAAYAAAPDWRRMPAVERAELLREAAERLRTQREELARLLTRETGRTVIKNRGYVEFSADTFAFYAEMGRNERGRVIASPEASQLSLVLHEPHGVVACIVPWNYPLLLLSWKVAPALAAGNTVVIKPATQTPLTTLKLADAFDHFPAGVVNIVAGRGSQVGDPLVTHPRVPMIAFTGSVETGKHIMRLAADRLKRVNLELGGKDAFVICPDADLELAAQAAAWAAFLNAGQVCTSAERIYVDQAVGTDFLDAFLDITENLVIGHGMDERTEITPMIGARERDAVDAQVQQAAQAGGEVVAGGRVPPGFARGFFYEPTVVVGAHQQLALADIVQTETFGPVAPVMQFDSFEDAIALCNDSPYGLGANLFTHDARRVKQFFEEVQAGSIWINDPLVDNVAGPFGGFKSSGIGRELGTEGLEAFREPKHVHWEMEGGRKPWWFPLGGSV